MKNLWKRWWSMLKRWYAEDFMGLSDTTNKICRLYGFVFQGFQRGSAPVGKMGLTLGFTVYVDAAKYAEGGRDEEVQQELLDAVAEHLQRHVTREVLRAWDIKPEKGKRG